MNHILLHLYTQSEDNPPFILISIILDILIFIEK